MPRVCALPGGIVRGIMAALQLLAAFFLAILGLAMAFRGGDNAELGGAAHHRPGASGRRAIGDRRFPNLRAAVLPGWTEECSH